MTSILEHRIEELEKVAGVGEQVVIWIHRIPGDDTLPTPKETDAAVANWKAKHPVSEFISLYWKDGEFRERPTLVMVREDGSPTNELYREILEQAEETASKGVEVNLTKLIIPDHKPESRESIVPKETKTLVQKRQKPELDPNQTQTGDVIWIW